jgi:hypothetical protein
VRWNATRSAGRAEARCVFQHALLGQPDNFGQHIARPIAGDAIVIIKFGGPRFAPAVDDHDVGVANIGTIAAGPGDDSHRMFVIQPVEARFEALFRHFGPALGAIVRQLGRIGLTLAAPGFTAWSAQCNAKARQVIVPLLLRNRREQTFVHSRARSAIGQSLPFRKLLSNSSILSSNWSSRSVAVLIDAKLLSTWRPTPFIDVTTGGAGWERRLKWRR